MRKPAIQARQGHARGIDDIGRAIVDATKTTIGKDLSKKVKRAASKAANDIPDPKYKKNPYNKKGGLTKDYKDYVLRSMKGQY